jgi:hypothetical protein
MRKALISMNKQGGSRPSVTPAVAPVKSKSDNNLVFCA